MVATIKDNDEIGHEMYAVAISDPAQAIRSVLKAANSESAVVNGSIDEAAIRSLGLKPGELTKIFDEKTDPLTSRTKRH